jgi:hypothetical protein
MQPELVGISPRSPFEATITGCEIATRRCDRTMAQSLLDGVLRGSTPGSTPQASEDEPAMRIYDIEFDIDSFLDEMEEMQRARRQQQRERQQQIHRSSDLGSSFSEPALERETD